MNSKLAAVFHEEATDHLDALERAFLNMESGKVDEAEEMNECLRRTHTFKGAARAIGLNELADRIHVFEGVLSPYRGGEQAVSLELIQTSLTEVNTLRRITEEAIGGNETSSLQTATVEPMSVAEVATIKVESSEPTPPAVENLFIEMPSEDQAKEKFSSRQLRVDSNRLDLILSMLGSLKISLRAGDAVIADVQKLRHHMGVALKTVREGHTEMKRVRSVQKIDRDAGEIKLQEASLAIRSAVDEMDILRAGLEKRRLDESLLIDQLEGEVRNACLVAISTIELGLERSVRDIAAERGKQASFKLIGGGVKLDRAVVDAIQEPLMHVVRNAVAHGLEEPDERLDVGKPTEGMITITASRLGHTVRLVVGDDGKGIDIEKLREKVVKSGFLDSVEAQISPADVLLDFIFHPGILTSESTDSLSGRGLGLEIARTRLRAFQGDARVLETGPTGTKFELILPVHLQILRIMTVRTASGTFGIPTMAIRRTRHVADEEVRLLEGDRVISSDNGPIRLVPLDRALGKPERIGSFKGNCLIMESGNRSVAIWVEELLQEDEVLIRGLGFPLGEIDHINGAAIQPDGSVLLILNPSVISDNALEKGVKGVSVLEKALLTEPRVLVVDDSPTTRSVLRDLFAAAGFKVTLASDGREARTLFQEHHPDIVVTDIEMPRMDGFSLTSLIKADPSGSVPVILVTGRESEEDRRKGLEVGADAYFVKSEFHHSELVDAVRKFL